MVARLGEAGAVCLGLVTAEAALELLMRAGARSASPSHSSTSWLLCTGQEAAPTLCCTTTYWPPPPPSLRRALARVCCPGCCNMDTVTLQFADLGSREGYPHCNCKSAAVSRWQRRICSGHKTHKLWCCQYYNNIGVCFVSAAASPTMYL